MRKFFPIILILFYGLAGSSGYSKTIKTVSPGKAALLIDSLETLLPNAPVKSKAALYDTLASLAEILSPQQSLSYYLKLYQLPDTLASYSQRIKATRKIAGIYLNMNQIDKANYYIEAYAEELKRYPQQTGLELINTLSEKNTNSTQNHFSITKNEVLILLILLIIVAVFYLSYIHRRFKNIEKKKKLLQREADIIRLKNRETEEELEKIIKRKTAIEEKEIAAVNKTHLNLKKELKKIEESIYNRNAFLNGLGPELRTALSSILGFSDELKNEVEKLGDNELKANSIDLYAKNLQLDVILENMVDMSGAQINLLYLDLKPHSILAIVDKVRTSLQYLTENNKGSLKVSIGKKVPQVKADAEKLIRVLNDIIINVHKQSTEGTVTLTVSTNQSKTEVTFLVSNTTDRISRTYSKKTTLTNSDSDSGKAQSSLQLYTKLFASRELLAAMGATMQVSLVTNEEVNITVVLPAAASTPETAKEDDSKAGQKQTKALLVSNVDIFLVEDDRMNRMVIETMLKDAGKVTTAVDGEETLQIIEKYHNEGKVFDIMLFDINLPPPWDGIALMHRIKKDYPEFRKVPFVAQTAYAMASDREKFLSEGFDDYLTKPINKAELLTIIHHQLELFKKSDDKKYF